MVYNILQIILLSHNCHILTYTIEDYDGGVDGVTYDGQQTRDKGIADGYSCQCVEGDDYQHVMEQAGNTADAETDIAETEADIDQHADNCYCYRQDRIGLHLVTDGGADGLGGDQCLIHAKIIHEHLIQCLSLIHIQRTGLEDNFIGALYGLDLNRTAGGALDQRYHLAVDLFQRIVLVKSDSSCGTALELQAVIQCITGVHLVDTHGNKSCKDHCQRQSEEDALLT